LPNPSQRNGPVAHVAVEYCRKWECGNAAA
jgi:hypothetical protein